jgi:hypothetical protein
MASMKSTRFPWSSGGRIFAPQLFGASVVSSIQIPAKLERLSFAVRRAFAAAVLRAAAGERARLLRILRGENLPNWTSLNAHLLADIGESTATAAREALRDPLCAPLGSIGVRAEDQSWPLLARAASRLG